ncbi:hybrid sensor histidine kinase/response regulator [Hyphomicrobium sp. NDB2Meth4]|uniref:ATP-binding response regulator n=1 Tax=Hyphomicrobium sp. NDB2Meth4 TaxID=1892846 RepID=UPI000B10347F|nr:hybrid sensor histidine kinase/response regulator [Hyphomicrobium sp. NDB2Meth4]
MAAEQVATLFSHVAFGVLAATAGAAILGGTLWWLGLTQFRTGMFWTGYIALCALAHILLQRSYSRARPATSDWQAWGMGFTAIALAEGLGWGWAPLYLVSGGFEVRLLAMMVVFGVAAGAIPAFSAYLPAFFAIFLPATLPYALVSLGATDPLAQASSLLMLVFIVALAILSVGTNRTLKDNVRLRIATQRMAEELRRQKEIVEQASLAKSTFLAAASHDLRQPIHALGLFVGALRAVEIPQPGRRLIEQIEASLIAMDGLFSALLDISRLDAGVVEVQKRPFEIAPFLARICRDARLDAEAKGLTVTCVHSGRLVDTDPVLLERIVRNLVSNAVRYTDRGRVLIGCRIRHRQLSIEVCDTGRGIAERDREKIFQEYFQVGNPERDRTKGLGLGLAIVRRLATLLDCPLSLRSVPGKGSCFSISVPLAAPDALATSDQYEMGPLATGLVLVVDDEIAIRQAMASLLGGWGHQVVAASSGDEAIRHMANCPKKPDLIISDLRLRDQETGIEVIERMRAEYNDTIPAMLITGDTSAARISDAQKSGLLVLHKPVPNGKLRAAIANLMHKAGSA